MNEKIKPQSKTEEFANNLAKCNTYEYIGICKILNVQITNGATTKEEFDMRPFEEIWEEIIEKFNNLGRAQRRELANIVKLAVSKDGTNSKR